MFSTKNEEFICSNLTVYVIYALKCFSTDHFFFCEANVAPHQFKNPLLSLYRNFTTTFPSTISTSSYYSRILSILDTPKQIKFQIVVSNLSAQSLVHCNSFFSDLGTK